MKARKCRLHPRSSSEARPCRQLGGQRKPPAKALPWVHWPPCLVHPKPEDKPHTSSQLLASSQQAGTAEPFGAGRRVDSAKENVYNPIRRGITEQHFINKKAKLSKSAPSISEATSRLLRSPALYAETNSTGRVTLSQPDSSQF